MVFPEPLLPTRATTCPRGALSETLERTVFSPYEKVTWSRWISCENGVSSWALFDDGICRLRQGKDAFGCCLASREKIRDAAQLFKWVVHEEKGGKEAHIVGGVSIFMPHLPSQDAHEQGERERTQDLHDRGANSANKVTHEHFAVVRQACLMETALFMRFCSKGMNDLNTCQGLVGHRVDASLGRLPAAGDAFEPFGKPYQRVGGDGAHNECEHGKLGIGVKEVTE